MKIYFKIFAFFLISTFLFLNCEDTAPELDPEVYIINSYRSNLFGGSIIVKYKVENNINRDINGWKVYFEVSLTNSQQLIASDQAEYLLKSGELSNSLEARVKLPEYYCTDVKPRQVVIKKIDIY